MASVFLNKLFLPRSVVPVTQALSSNLQNRTVFVVKRKWEPPLPKANHPRRVMRSKHFIYDLVEDTTLRKQNNMNVKLTQYVESIGGQGEIVSLKPNVAYNKLLLPGCAAYVDSAEQQVVDSKKEIDYAEHSSPYAQRTINMLNRITLAVVMNKDKSWVLEPWHIRTSLRKVGFYCDDSCITLPKTSINGPDLEKENKDFFVTVTINNKEKTELRCRIHHWSTDPSNRLPYVFEHWKHESEPLKISNE